MVVVKTYETELTRENRWWLIEVDGIVMTQARSLKEARVMAIDMIAVAKDVPSETIDVSLRPKLDAELEAEVDKARSAIRDLDEQQRIVAASSRLVARKLVHSAGLTGRDAAVVLGISPQRVSQLLAD